LSSFWQLLHLHLQVGVLDVVLGSDVLWLLLGLESRELLLLLGAVLEGGLLLHELLLRPLVLELGQALDVVLLVALEVVLGHLEIIDLLLVTLV